MGARDGRLPPAEGRGGRLLRAVVACALAVLLAGCSQPAAEIAPPASTAPQRALPDPAALADEHCGERSLPRLAEADPADPGWSFRDVTDEANLTHKVGGPLPPSTHPMETLGGGIAVGDADGDGWPDVYVADAAQDRLFRNRGDGTFEEVALAAGMEERQPGRAAVWFDMDGDADQDLFVANFEQPSRLWRNDGGLRFTDVSEAAGVKRATTSQGVAAVDVDGDGDLDVSVANYGRWHRGSQESNADAHNGQQDFLYVNQGDGTFAEEAVERGIVETKWTFSHAWADFDRDGDQDLYLNVDFGIDALYVNDGTGRFTEEAVERGMFTDGNGMGAVWLDHDNDQDLDLFATAIRIGCNRDVPQFKGNDLFRNDGGRFVQVASEAGVADGGWGWGSAWQDFDHDGDLDGAQATGFQSRGFVDRYHDALVYLSDTPPAAPPARNDGTWPSTAYIRYNATKFVVWSFFPPLSKAEVDASSQGGHQEDRFWMNEGGRFRDVAPSVALGGFRDTRAFAAIDHDRDGDMDLLRSSWQHPLALLRNEAVEEGRGHWLQLELEGRRVGAIVEARAGDLRLVRHLAASGSFVAQDEALVHLGLGPRTVVDEVVVHWPSGAVSRLEDVAADRRIVVREG